MSISAGARIGSMSDLPLLPPDPDEIWCVPYSVMVRAQLGGDLGERNLWVVTASPLGVLGIPQGDEAEYLSEEGLLQPPLSVLWFDISNMGTTFPDGEESDRAERFAQAYELWRGHVREQAALDASEG
jgi:hypothetical protein